MKQLFYLYSILILSLSFSAAIAQEDEDWGSLLVEEIEIENPVYKPVTGFSMGMLSFYGDLNEKFPNLIQGSPAYRLNVSSYIDNMHYFKWNINVIYGDMSARDNIRNLNFKSNIITFGLNAHYEFGHFRVNEKRFTPFISVGVEGIFFDSKSDLTYGDNNLSYNYWSDGTIRDISESQSSTGNIISHDNKFETDLQSITGQTYDKTTFGIPIDVGFDFIIGPRVEFRFGTSYHYTFTDFLDNLSSTPVDISKSSIEGAASTASQWNGIAGDSKNDAFFYTYFSVHLDLWSDAKTKMDDRMFAEVDFDHDLLTDEDSDFVFDISDECPGTPFGIETDSLGCPYDTDNDGIPDYLDKEFDTPIGAIVDENGVQMSDSDIASLLDNSAAVGRGDVYEIPLQDSWSKYGFGSKMEIPAKYKSLDRDGDGYISFGELMNTIDDFFDGSSPFTVQDIYDINEFFFKQ